MAGILRGGTCGGSRSSGSQDTRTYVPPTFAEAADVSEEIRERRADVGRSIALRVLAAVLIFSAIGIGLFPKVLQYQSAQKLASTSARSEQSVAGWPYPQSCTTTISPTPATVPVPARRAQAPLAMVTRIPLAPKTRNTSVCWILAMA